MFEKNLTELVKGIRANKDSEGEYIAKALGEIKKELQQSDGAVKAVAVQKLVFLNMLGYTLEPYAFHIVEVMSQPWYGHRRVAYLAASQSFTSKTDVILLTTHLFRKAFSSSGGSPYEAAAALNCLSNVVTKDLAMDLLSDVFGMLNSSRVYLRKKAVLVLLRIFQAWPKALRLSFDRLKEKLTDDDPGVVSAAVYVLCELAAANPKNYVPLAPLFFKIMTNSQNNWVMIKVVKLMGLLVPLEPRLAKKLANPLSDIIESTPAKSLVYECINTLLSGKITSKAVIRLCLDKLREFIENYDQNLKYLGLLGLNKLMRQHPRAVAEHTELILECLADDDTTIRMRALDLISGMVSKRNIKGITRRLLEHAELSDGSYREHVLARVLSIGSHDNYCYIADFEWYVSTLVDVTQFHGASRDNADTVAAQLIDLAIRVEGVRPFVVACMVDLIHDTRLHDAQDAMSCVLIAAAHIVGEFSRYVEDHAELVRSMLSGSIATLDHKTQTVFIQNFIKVFAAGASLTLPAAADADDAADDAPAPTPAPTVPRAASMTDWRARVHQMAEIVKTRLPLFSQSNHIEVQERACAYLPVIEWIDEQVASPSWDEIGGAVPDEQQSQQAAAERLDPRAVTDQLRALFAGMLTPVKASAQKKVPVPRGLDLDAWINEPEQSSDEDAGSELDDEHFWSDASSQQSWRAKSKQMSPEALERAAKERARRRRAREQDPYYINDSARPARNAHHGSEDDFLDDDSIGGDLNVRDIPISQAPEDLPPLTVESTSSRRTRNQHRGRISRGRGFSEEDIHESSGSRYTVKSFDDGAAAENEARARGSDSEEGGLGEVDLTKPLGDDEVIPHVLTYAERERAANKKNRDGKKKKKKKGESSKKKKKKRDKGGDSAAAQPEMARTESFDPLAAPEPKKSKKHKKHSKRNGAEQLLDVRPAVCQQTLFHNDALTVTASVFSVEDDKKARKSKSKSKKGAKPAALACARITFTAHVPISGVSVALSSASKHVKVVRAEPRAEAMGALAAGEVAVQSHILKLHKMAAPVQLQAALSVSGGAPSMLDTPLVVPLSAIVLPVKMSAEQITDLMTGDECAALAATKLKLNSLSVGEALKLVPSVLNVALIRAANYTAMFHGQTARGRHVVVLVKANKDEAKQANAGISVQVKSGSEGISQQLLDELHAALTA